MVNRTKGSLLNFNLYEVFDSCNEIRWSRHRFSSSIPEPEGSMEIFEKTGQGQGDLWELTQRSTPDPNTHLKHRPEPLISHIGKLGTFVFLNSSIAKIKIKKKNTYLSHTF